MRHLLKIDSVYSSFDRARSSLLRNEEDQLPGGLTGLFGLVYHVEQELEVGTFAKTKDKLSASLESLSFGDENAAIARIIRALVTDRSRALDAALIEHDRLSQNRRKAWEEYLMRLAKGFARKLPVEVIPGFSVPGEDYGLYRSEIRAFAEQFRNRLEATGIPPKVNIEPSLSKEPKKGKTTLQFPALPDLKWSEVTIVFQSNDYITISARDTLRRFHYAEIGLGDRRKGDSPSKLWLFLKNLAYLEEISYRKIIDGEARRTAGKKISDIRKILKRIMNVPDDPFYPYSKEFGWKPIFKLVDESYSRSDEI